MVAGPTEAKGVEVCRPVVVRSGVLTEAKGEEARWPIGVKAGEVMRSTVCLQALTEAKGEDARWPIVVKAGEVMRSTVYLWALTGGNLKVQGDNWTKVRHWCQNRLAAKGQRS